MRKEEGCPDVDGHSAIEGLRGGNLYVIPEKRRGVVHLTTVIIILTALGLIRHLTAVIIILTALALIRHLTTVIIILTALGLSLIHI